MERPLPKDPAILFSYINTMLRDRNISFEELCGSLDVSGADIKKSLSEAGFTYDESRNLFR